MLTHTVTNKHTDFLWIAKKPTELSKHNKMEAENTEKYLLFHDVLWGICMCFFFVRVSWMLVVTCSDEGLIKEHYLFRLVGSK